MNSIAQVGALAALEDDEHLRETKRVVDEGRAYLHEQFAKMKVPFVQRDREFRDGPSWRRARDLRETAQARHHRAPVKRVQLARMGPHLGRHNGGEQEISRGTKKSSPSGGQTACLTQPAGRQPAEPHKPHIGRGQPGRPLFFLAARPGSLLDVTGARGKGVPAKS